MKVQSTEIIKCRVYGICSRNLDAMAPIMGLSYFKTIAILYKSLAN
jgi:hypothetical protein